MKITYAEAFLTAIGDAMAADPRVSLIGRPFSLGPTRVLVEGLRARFPDRVSEPPISEPATAALGAGAAMAGMHPFVDLATGAFSFLAFSQLVNEAPVAHYMSGGRLAVPVTYHVTQGVRGAGAPQHSHDMHGHLWNSPGLQILMPANPADAYGLVRAALASRNPSIILSHFKLAGVEGELPEPRGALPLGKAEIKRRGRDVTVVALSLMVQLALRAAAILAAEGIEVEVLDPRTLAPFDEEAVLASVARTGRLVVVDETPLQGGVASGIAGMVAERGFHSLKAPVQRVARADTPVPFSPPMEEFIIPNEAKIIAAIRRVVQVQ